MKITIEENENYLSRVYPYLGKTKKGLVVAFIAPKTGVVVDGRGTQWNITNIMDTWDEDNFTPMHPQPEPEPDIIPLEDRKYPYVGKDEFEQLVLFTNPKTGMLIKEASEDPVNTLLDVGDWAESAFTPIPVSRIIIDLE